MRLDERAGPAAGLHARSAAEVEASVGERRMLVLEASADAVVLGSAQPDSDVDRAAAAALGLEVARRRSGGGAVLVGPGRCLWVDVVVGRHDTAWDDDVGRAAWWIGEAWARALGSLGCTGAEVWRGPLRRSSWSSKVCFLGLGQGEVTVGGRKVVGLSQRRTRHGALFQTAALLDGDQSPLVAALALSGEERDSVLSELHRSTLSLGPGCGPRLQEELRLALLSSE